MIFSLVRFLFFIFFSWIGLIHLYLVFYILDFVWFFLTTKAFIFLRIGQFFGAFFCFFGYFWVFHSLMRFRFLVWFWVSFAQGWMILIRSFFFSLSRFFSLWNVKVPFFRTLYLLCLLLFCPFLSDQVLWILIFPLVLSFFANSTVVNLVNGTSSLWGLQRIRSLQSDSA